MKISEEDALEVATIIAKQAVDEIKTTNQMMLLKSAGISIVEYNNASEEEQENLLKKAESICTENLTDEFKNAIIENPKDFFTKHTELFDEAEIELEEYLIKE